MKSLFTTLITIFFMPFILFAQQVENGGFEEWEEVGLGPDIIEPVNWSTIKTSDNPSISSLAPITWEKSTDAHSGQYSVKLHNTSTLGIAVSGTMSNGQYHPNLNTDLAYVFTNTSDPRWNTPYTSRPDSIAFWMKFFPDGNDTLQFQALLHVGEATLPPKPENLANQVAYIRADIGGTYENWTRIALAFDYFDDRTPEYILIIITSGNGTTPNIGSYAFYDDLEIIDNGQSVQDNPLSQIELFVSEKTIHIKNIPTDLLMQSHLEVFDILGKSLWKCKIQSDKVALNPTINFSGTYIIKISTSDFMISKKVKIN